MNATEYLQNTTSLIVGVACYILLAIPLYSLGQKAGKANAWFAFVPILNMLLLLDLADKELWWIILFFIPCIGWIVYMIAWASVAESVNKPSWMGYLCGLPCFNVFMPFVIAFT